MIARITSSLLFIALVVALFSIPRGLDFLAWHQATGLDHSGAYKKYLTDRPSGHYYKIATERFDSRTWQEQSANATEASLLRYLQRLPRGNHRHEALDLIEQIHWNTARATHDLKAIAAFIEQHPDGRLLDEATALLDKRSWNVAEKSGTWSAFQGYLDQFPTGAFRAGAKVGIERLAWRNASSDTGSLSSRANSYSRFLEDFPDSRHASEAKRGLYEIAREQSVRNGTSTDLEDYIRANPGNRLTEEATTQLYEFAQEKLERNGSTLALEKFLTEYPRNPHAAEARSKIDNHRWAHFSGIGTIAALKEYREKYASAPYVDDAKTRIEALLNDSRPFKHASDIGTVASFEKFLSDYPGHPDASRAGTIIENAHTPVHIVDLLAEKKIVVKVTGQDIESLKLEIKRFSDHPLTVSIPAGTFFVSTDRTAQNMVATSDRRILLERSDVATYYISVACANRRRTIPNAKHNFLVRRLPYPEELGKLVPAIARTHANSKMLQAAVWIVSDNASYKNLGSLRLSRAPFVPAIASPTSNSRAIGESEASEAMKICADAGIPIKNKAIWRDRHTILNGLPDGTIKTWLLSH